MTGRFAVGGYFVLNGLILSSWVPRIPQIRDELGMRPAVVGAVLLMIALGALVAMPTTSVLITKWGPRTITAVSGVGYGAALAGVGFATSTPQLAAALLCVGLANGTLDVAMNTMASAVEQHAGRVLMPWFHGLFSVGGLLGAGLGAGAAVAGVPPSTQFFWVGLAGVLAAAGLHHRLPVTPAATARREGGRRGLPRELLPFGLMAFVVLLAEGAMADWSALYLTDEVGTSPGVAAGGYVVFVLSMAIGRLFGSRITEALGTLKVFRSAAGVMALGLVLLLAVPSVITTFVACLLLGIGVSCLFPLLLNRAAAMPGQPASHSVAALSVVGYFGFLGGPPAIGLLADATSLRVALVVLALAPALVLLFSRVVTREHRERELVESG